MSPGPLCHTSRTRIFSSPAHPCKAGLNCDQVHSASLLQGKEGLCPATLVPSPKLGNLYADPQPPPSPGTTQPVARLFFLATHLGNRFALRHGLFFCSHLRVAPEGALARRDLAVLPP